MKRTMKPRLPFLISAIVLALGVMLMVYNYQSNRQLIRDSLIQQAHFTINEALHTCIHFSELGMDTSELIKEFNKKQKIDYVYLMPLDSARALINEKQDTKEEHYLLSTYGAFPIYQTGETGGLFISFIFPNENHFFSASFAPFAIVYNGEAFQKASLAKIRKNLYFLTLIILMATLFVWLLLYFRVFRKLQPLMKQLLDSPSSKQALRNSDEISLLVSTLENYFSRQEEQFRGLQNSNTMLEKEIKEKEQHLEKLKRKLQQETDEKKIIEQEFQTLQKIIEQSPLSIVITDPEANIEYVNPKFVEVTGYTFEEVRGKNPRILKSGSVAQETYAEMWRTISQGFTWQGEFHNKKKNGELYWESAYISPVRNSNGEIIYYFAIKEDITKRKELMATREMYAQAIKNVAEIVTITDLDNRLIYVNDAFEKKYGYRKEEVLGVHISFLHPEKNVLLSKEVLEQSLNGGWEGELVNISKTGEKMTVHLTTSMIKDEKNNPFAIVGISRDITEEKLNRKLEQKAEMLKTLQELAGAISHEFSQPLQALHNYLALMEIGRQPEKYIKKSKVSVEKIAALVNNLRDLTSIERRDYLNTKILNLKASADKGNTPEQTKRILIVDDEQEILDTLVEMLKLAGYDVDGASDGMEGLKRLRENDYHLILSDINMPRMSGPTFFDKVRIIGYENRFIFMTGYAVSKEIHEVIKKGDGVLYKPVDSLQLLDIVQQAIGKATYKAEPYC